MPDPQENFQNLSMNKVEFQAEGPKDALSGLLAAYPPHKKI